MYRNENPVNRQTYFRSPVIWNKFDALEFIIDTKIDIFLVSETFRTAEFLLKRFSTLYKFNKNSKGNGFLLYICKNIQFV